MSRINGNLRRGRGPTVAYPAEDFATMSAAITAAVAGGATAPIGLLWKRGAVGQSLIGAWQYSSALSGIRPIGPVNLANVSATPVGVVASGTGTTRTVDASPLTLGTSGTVTVWDISAGSAIATGVAYTRSGTTVTFTGGDPGATAAGDLLLDTSACEFRLGTDWVPTTAGVWYFSGTGLQSIGDSSAGGCEFPGIYDWTLGDDSPLASLRVTCNTVESTTTSGAFFAASIANSTDALASGVQYNGSNWTTVVGFNGPLSPSWSQPDNCSAPGTGSGVRLWCNGAPATTGNLSFQTGADGGNIGATPSSVVDAGLADNVHPYEVTGPPEHVLLHLNAGAGQLDILWTSVELQV